MSLFCYPFGKRLNDVYPDTMPSNRQSSFGKTNENQCQYRFKLTLSANISTTKKKKDFPTFFKDILKFINSQLTYKHTRSDCCASRTENPKTKTPKNSFLIASNDITNNKIKFFVSKLETTHNRIDNNFSF